MEKIKVGVIGCGNISSIYLQNIPRFEILELAACADLDMSRAQAQAEKYNAGRACTVDEMLADPEIKIVVNLTIPRAHAEVALQAIAAGKSVYNEKPLAITREDGMKILTAAKAKGVRVSNAPDTVLGGGIQTCLKLINDGWIGEPIGCTAFMTCHGHESWHPDPEFYYKVGGGPMFDMGPYYLTALVMLMGSVKRVTGSTRVSFPERTITSEAKRGTVMKVDVPTHVVGILDFDNGAIGNIITSFDVWAANLPAIEIYGTLGSLSVPDPNGFGGPVKLRIAGASEWSEMPLTHGYSENFRGIGVADMAYGISTGRPHRVNGELGYHVLDIMHAIHDSSLEEKHIKLTSGITRPTPLPMGLLEGLLDE